MKAKTAGNAILYGEAGQDLVEMVALTDSGDHTNFTSADVFWSDASGKSPSVIPDGLATGGAVTVAASGSNDVADVAALTCYLAGVLASVAADADFAVTRGDASYILLSLAAAGYTSCVAGDIGKTVTGGTTGDTGTLIAYNNTTRKWLVDPADAGDLFDDAAETYAIGTGTGAGTSDAVAVAAPYLINSITVNSSGALALVQGTQGAAFATDRGVIGGPPFIPVGSIEIAQVRYTSTTAAAVAASEIKQVVGTHCERYDSPIFDINYADGEIDFISALPAIHTGSTAKKVYAEYYTPTFAEIPNSSDFVAPENAYTVNSEQVYGGTIGSESSSLGQGSFKARLQNGVNDSVLLMKDDTRWLKFYPDRTVSTKYITCQGKIGVKRTFPPGGSMVADVTISSSEAAADVAS